MAEIDRTFSELRTRLKEHESALPADDFRNMLALLDQASGQADDLQTAVSQKDGDIVALENRLEWAEGESAHRSAQFLCDWARGEDPRVVRKVTEAIGGGHASDLSLIFN